MISAEIPDPVKDPEGHAIITKHNIHGPCYPGCKLPCHDNDKGVCSKKFPKPFIAQTKSDKDGYPQYRRRTPEDGGFTATLNKGSQEITVDNR